MASPIAEKHVKETEKELNFIFPIEYKTSICQENGGVVASRDVDWELYPVRDSTNNKSIARTFNHVITETALACQWNNFPSVAVAIGEDGTGDKLILLPSSSIIYHWFHETGEIEEVATTFDVLERVN